MPKSAFHATVLASAILVSSLFHGQPVQGASCPVLSFLDAGTFSAGANPGSVAVGDFNGDGRIDLAVANKFSPNVSILLGNGNGTFQAPVTYGAGSSASFVAVGDFNGDGKGDLAVASGNVWVLLGNGDGSFQGAVSYMVGSDPQSVAVGDFDADGKSDLAVANRSSSDEGLSVLLGNGDGTFQTADNYLVGANPIFVVMGDFNGDGKPDLAVANSAVFGDGPPNVSVLLGVGNGRFLDAVNYDVGPSPRSIAVGDFNSDGKLDMAVANFGQFVGSQFTGSSVSVLLGNGDGTFQAAVNYPAGQGPISVVASDFNGDGPKDLAVANNRSANVSVLVGNSNGTFQAAMNYSTGANPSAVAAGDFNGGGQPDVAVANGAGVSILLSTCVPTADLKVTLTGLPSTLQLGQNLTYTIVATNGGLTAGTNVIVADTLPPGVSYVSANTTQGTTTLSNNVVYGSLGILNFGASATITIVVTATAPGSLTNAASISGSGPDSNPANNSATVVNTVNNPPTISSIANQMINEDTNTVAIAFTVGDVETNPGSLTVSGASSNPNLVTNANFVFGGSGANRTVTITPLANRSGVTTITITVSDGGATTSTNFVLTVNPVNDPPSFVKGLNQTVFEDAGAQSVTGWATAISPGPPEEASQSLTFVVTNNANGLFAVQPAVSPNGTLTYTSALNSNGTATVTVRLQDNGGTANGGIDTSAPQTFTITVTAVNDAPSFTKGSDQTVPEDAGPRTITGWATSISAGPPDEAGQSRTFLVSNNTNALFSAQPAIASNGTLTYTTTNNANGTATVTVQLQDNGGTANGGVNTSAPQTFAITVTPVNDPPVLAAIADQTVNEGSLLTVNCTATDPDLPADTLTFSLDPGAPSGASINPGSGVFSWTPTDAQGPSTNTITVRVTDAGSPPLSNTKSFTVVVGQVNTPPSLTISNQTINEGSPFMLTITATDPDIPANTLTYSLLSGPTGASLTSGGLFSWTPTEAQGPGSYTNTVRVTDDGAPPLSATNSFTIVVNEVNSAPTLAVIADQTVNEGSLLTVTASGSDSDVPANTLTYSLEPGAPAGMTINNSSGVVSWTPTEPQGPSTSPVTVRVTDSGVPSLSATRTFTVTVNESNSPPVLGVIANQTVNEGSLLTVSASASDPDVPANTLTYSLDPGSPAGMTINGSSGVVSWTPTELQGPNTSTVTVRVTDNGVPSLSATRTFTVTVNESNSPPVLAVIADQTVNEGSLLTVTASGSDSDVPANTLTYSLDPGAPAGMTINSSSGVVSWTPTEAQGPGTSPVTVRVTDNGVPSLSATRTFTVTVNESNSPPVLAVIANQTVNEGSLLTVSASASDPDVPANTLTYSLDAGAPAGMTINASSGVVSWTPTEAQGPGTSPVTVRVTDNGVPSLSATRTFNVTVNEVNNAPVLAVIADQTVNEGSLLTVTTSGSDSDVPANSLTYSLDSGAPAGMTINASSGVVSWTPTEAQGPSTSPVTVRVTDNGVPSLSATRTFNVTVNESNSPPVLAVIANQTVNEGSLLTVTASGSDTDVPANTLTYSLEPGAPAGMTINASGVLSWTPTEAQGPGTSPVTVRVTDNGVPSLSATRTFTVTVNEVNNAPTLGVIANQTVNEGSLLTVTASGNDSDVPANTLTYSLEPGAPAGMTINASSGVVSWTPTEAQGPSTSPVTVRVSDNGTPSLGDTRTFNVTVNEVNNAPVLGVIANQTVNEGSLLTLTAAATDADVPANTLTYSLDPGAPSGASINATSGLFSWTPSEAQGPGSYPITVRATDNGTPSLSDAKSFTVTVNEVNSAPVLGVIANQTVNEGSLLTVTASATDNDAPTNTLTFSLVSPPAGASINASSGLFSWTPSEAQGPGNYTITVQVTDGGSPALSDTKSFTVTVNEVNSAPTLAVIANQTVNEGSLLTVTASGSDTDVPANTLTYSLDPGAPAGMTINASGVLSWTPSEAQGPGTSPVTVRVTDSGVPSLSATRTFNVTVNEVNSAPTLGVIANQTVNEGSLLTVTASGSDSDVPANTLTYSLEPGAPAGMTINASSGVLSWTPTEAQGPSTSTVTVRVTDNGTPSLSDTKSFTVTVSEVNSAPVLGVIANQTVNEGATLTLTASATDADVPANTLTYSLEPGAPAGMTINASSGVLSWTPTEAQGPSTSTVTVRVTDNGVPSLSDTKSFSVTVNEVNSAPVLGVIANQTVNESSSLTLTASASDGDVPANTLSFSLVSPPAGASINASSGVFSWTPSEAQGPGNYTITVQVTDSGSPALSDTKSFTVTVNEVNTTPVLAVIANQTVNEGSLLTVTASASDTDVPANTLTYSLDPGAPAGMTINASSGVLSWTPTEAQGPGTSPVTVRVTDSGVPSLSATRTFNVTVNEVNSAPTLGVIANQTVNEGSLLTVTASGNDSDVPANTLTYSLDPGAPAGMTINASSGVVSWTPTEAQGPSTSTVTVRVTDNGTPSLSDTRTFNVTVNEVNNAPVLGVIANQTVNEGSVLTLTASATDADVPANTLTYSLDPGAPAGASINSTSGQFSWTPSEAQGPGSYPIMVRATDNGTPSLSDAKSFTVTVNEVNSAPVLGVIANQTVNEGSLLTVTVSASDGDAPANTLSFSLVSPPAGASINANSGVFSWTPSEAQGPGNYTITVQVTDNGSPPLSDTKSFTVTVSEVNSAPTLGVIANQTVNEGSLLTVTASGSDTDVPANTLTYSLDPGAPAGMTINASGVLSWTPTEAQGPGTSPVTVRVTDSGVPSLSATRTFNVTVNEVNSAPTLGVIANQTVNEGSLLTVTASGNDSDAPANTLTYSLEPGAPAGMTINASSGVVSWTPTEAQGPSTSTVTVRVSDSGSPPLSDTKSFSVTVNEVNNAPVLGVIANQTVNEGSLLTLTASATDTDVPANTLTYSLDPGAPSGASINSGSGVFSWTPSEAQGPGSYPITVRATDNGTPSLSDAKTFTVTVNEVNSAPVLGVIANQTVNEGSLLTVTVSATDNDVPANTLSFSLVSPPAGAAINASSGVFSWTPSEAQGPGSYTITVQVTDSGSPALSDTKSFTVTVSEVNSAPTLGVIANQTVNEGSLLTVTASGSDTDVPANTLTYSLDPGAPAGMTINASGVLSWTPTEAQGPGTSPVTVRVTDSGVPSLSATRTFNVTVNEVNSAPTLGVIANQTVNEGSLLTVTASGSDSDVPANTLTYSLDPGAPAGMTINGSSGVLSWTPTEAQGPGTSTVTVRVSDSGSPPLSDTKSFTVTVSEVNSAPVLGVIANQTVNEGATLTLTASATDTDVPANTLTYSLDSGAPSGASINATSGQFSWTPSEAQGPGSYPITVRATDNGTPSLSDAKTFTVTVNEVNSAPVLGVIANQTVNEGSLLTVSASGNDTDVPANTLTYSLEPGAPAGMTINGSSGVLSWTPTEAQGPSTSTVTVRVTDSGSPALSDTKSFTVTVSEVNSAPTLGVIANQTVNEGSLLTVTASGSDSDVPANTLTYSLDPGAPAGMTINASGVLSWTPSEAQGPGTSPVTVRVTDSGVPSLSATRTFNVTVNEVNSAPVLAVIANQTVNEGSLLTVTASGSDSDVPANTLTYSLEPGAPAGMTINGSSGVLSWTPTEAQGPSTSTVTVRVTDNGTPSLSDTKTFNVTVNEVNNAPVLGVIANQTVNEGSLLTLTASATDTDVPANTLTYSLVSAPAGANINASSGVFTWTPSEIQGPSTNTVTVRVTDTGTPNLSDTKSFTVVVNEVNSAPVLAAIPSQTVNESSTLTLTITATDTDVPNNTPTYSLTSAPSGASINSISGVFSWTPTESQGPGTYTITAQVTDSGSPALSDTKSFTVTVNEVNTAPVLAAIADRTVNEGTTLSFTVTATDTDLPGNTLSYSLDPGAPAGATINGNSGVFSWTPTEGQGPSTNMITVRVTDNGTPSLSDTSSFTVIVNETNASPVLTAIANQTINEGSTLTLTATATDPDLPANVLMFSLVSPPAGASINANSGVLTWTPSETQGPGSHTITVSVTDSGTPPRSDTKSFIVTVNEVNSAPVLDPIFEKTIKELNTLTFTITADDADVPANTLTFTLLTAPAGASVNPTTGVFTWTPTAAQGPSTNILTVRVADNGTPSLSATQSFTIVVTELNSSPVLGATADQTINEGSTLNTTITASDPDIPANILTFSLVSPPAGASINPTTGLFTWTPTEAQGPSTNTLTVHVTDNGVPSLSDTRTFTVIVNEVNTAPVLAVIANQTVNEGAPLSFTVTATDADVPANALTYSLDAGAPTGASINPNTGVFTWTPTEAQGPSTNNLTVRVTDSGSPGLSNTRTFSVVVNESNAAPVLAVIANETINEGSTLTVPVTATDGDQPANTLAYSLISPPAGATINASTGVLTWTPSESQGPSTNTLVVRVTDNGTPALSDTKSFTVVVTEVNSPPVVGALSNRTVNEGGTLSFTVSATDPDLPANALTYALEPGAPAGASINATTGLFTWTPNEAQGPSSFVINVRVIDDGIPSLSDTKSFTVTVNEVNTAPVLAAIANQTINEGSTLTVTATASDSDVPANTVTYSLDPGAPLGASIDPSTGVFTWTPTESQGPSTNSVTLRATDNGSPPQSDTKSFTVVVNEVNSAPVLAAIANQTVNEGSTLMLTNTATDADLPANTLTFSLVSPPAGASINPTTGVFTWTPSEDQGPGTSTITVQVADSGTPSRSDQKSFTVTINEVNRPPVLAALANQTVNEGSTLSVTAVATDPDLPANILTFSLISPPAGASINPVTGAVSWVPTEGQGPGTYTIGVRVTDNGSPNLSGTNTFTVTVNEVNSPPVLVPIANQGISEGSTLSFTVTASDSDVPANVLTYSLEPGAPSGASINPSSGVFTWTPSASQAPSTNTIAVRVTDNGSPPLSDTKSFIAVVGSVNRTPVLAAIPNQTVNEGATLTLTLSATDPDGSGDTLTFSLLNPPAGAAINPVTGVLTWTPTEAQGPGTNTLTARVTDNGVPNLSDTKSFTVVIPEVNTAPVLAAMAGQTLNEGSTLVLTNTATDADVPANTVTFSLDPGGPAGVTINATTGVLTWTPGESQGGTTNTITVRATDNGSPNLSDTKSFTVTVNEVNRAPDLAALANQTVNEGSSLTLTITATDPDVPANSLTFSLISPPAGASINPVTGVFSWTPTEAQGPSSAVIQVRVTDNGSPNLSDTNSFTVTVNEVNSPPVLTPIANQAVNEGSTLTLTASATDPDLPVNALTFSLVSAPAGASINPSTGAFTWTPGQGAPATSTIAVRVTDNGSPSLSATQSFIAVVGSVNRAPVLAAIQNQTVNEGTVLTVTITATDPDGPTDVLTFSLLNPPAGAAINPVTGVFTWAPTEAQGPSTNAISVRVTDNGVPPLGDTKSFTVVANEVNSAPVLAAIPNQNINEGITLVRTNTATDVDLPINTLTFSLVNPPAGAAIDPSTGVFTWAPNPNQASGTTTITVRVTDNGMPSLSDTKSFIVTANEVNSAPVLAAIANQTVNEGTTLTLTATATDPDLPANTLTFTLISPPAGAAINPVTGMFTWTPTEAQGPSTNVISVRVTDNGSPNLSDTKSFTVTVSEVNSAPVLTPIANQPANEGGTLTLTASATDPDLPANALTFSLISAPSGASINPSTGLFTWTPGQGAPGTSTIAVRVTDNGSPSLSATQSFIVVVGSVNRAPVLAAISNQTVNEGTVLTVTITATDPDGPTDALTFSLLNPPAGAAINPVTGVFTWAPTEAQAPSTNAISVRVTDNGVPPLSDTKSFTVVANEVNSAPVLAAIPNQNINEGITLVLTNTATDVDLPINTLTFSLVNPPTGAVINPSSGVFTWTPSPDQASGTTTITVRVTDNGSPSLSDTKSFIVTANEVNRPPVLAAMADQTVNEGSMLTLTATATDPDLPANTLTFSLVSSLSGASINPVTGVFSWVPTEGQGPGTYTIRVRVTDNGSPNLSDTKSFTVTVNEVNSPPVLTPIANQPVNEGGTLTLTASATDPDLPANALTFSLISAPSGASINPSTGLFTWTPGQGAPGTSTIAVRVTDNGSPSLSATQSFIVVVGSVNRAPVLAAIPNQTVNEGTVLTVTITATDPDGPTDALTFSLLNPPAGAAINPVTGVFTWAPTEAQAPSTNAISVRVTDNGVPPLSDTKSFTVVANEVNSAPVLAAIPNQNINEGITLVLTNTATDVDLPVNTLTFSLVNPPTGAVINPSSGVFTWTPSPDQASGTTTITVRVTDNGAPPLSDTKSFIVTANEVNSAPVLAAMANQTVNEGSMLTLTATATDLDLPANSLTFSLVSSLSGASINPVTGVFSWVPTEAQGPSPYTIRVRVTDNGSPNLSDTKSFTVTVNEVNSPPVLTPIANQPANEGSPLTLTASATDPDLPANALTFSLISAPSGASINPSSGVFTWTPGQGAPGTSTIAVRVTDNGSPSLSATQSFIAVVGSVNRAPVLAAIQNQTVSEGSGLTLTITATDPDGPADTLTFSLLNPPAGAAINPVTGVFTWAPTEAQGPSTNIISVRVTDNGVLPLGDTKSFTVVVNEVNSAPVLTAIPNRNIKEAVTLVLTNTATDVDLPVNTLTFSLVNPPAGAAIDPSTGVFTWTPDANQVSVTTTIRVRVTDNGVPPLSDTKSFLVTSNEVNSAPVLAAMANQTVNEGSMLALTVNATDPDLPANSLIFSLISPTAGASINPVTGVFSWVLTEAQGPGMYTIRVRVTDNGSPNLSDTKSFTLTVNEVNSPPVLTPIPNQLANEGSTLTLTASATDPDLPVNALTFSLVSAPSGASINPSSGLFAWTPSRSQAPSVNTIAVRVTDNGSPPLSATQSFVTVVGSVNTGPLLSAIPNQTVNEGSGLTLTITATDPDGAADTLTFSLLNPPVGAAINPVTGVFTWTPTEAQGPSTNAIRVRVTDNGVPPLSDTKSFTVVVNEVNSAPVLAAIGTQLINEGSTLTLNFGANDPDIPGNTLNYSLVTAPSAAAVSPVSGVFTWTPTGAQAPGTNLITVRVTDNGSPNLSDEKTFSVVVTPLAQVLTLRITPSGSNLIISANVPLDGYELQVKDNLASTADWTTLPNVPVGNAFILPLDPSKKTQLYRVRQRSSSSITLRITPSGNNLIISANAPLDGYELQVKDNLTSTADWITLPNVPVANTFIVPFDSSKKTQVYRVRQRSSSSITLRITPSGNNLIISANGPLDGYELQVKDTLTSAADWTTLPNVPVGNQFILPLDPSSNTRFYRIRPRSASSLTLRITTSSDNLIITGSSPLDGFDLQATDGLSAPAVWITLPTVPVDNVFTIPLDLSRKFRFYRLKQRSL